MMELYAVGLLGLMIMTTVIIKGIFCWMHCWHPVPWEKPFPWKVKLGKKTSYSPTKEMTHMIPMEDIERTSTPVPTSERIKPKAEFQSDV